MTIMPKTMLIEGRRYVVQPVAGGDDFTSWAYVEQPAQKELEAPEAKGEKHE
jgi:hypothetical protein